MSHSFIRDVRRFLREKHGLRIEINPKGRGFTFLISGADRTFWGSFDRYATQKIATEQAIEYCFSNIIKSR